MTSMDRRYEVSQLQPGSEPDLRSDIYGPIENAEKVTDRKIAQGVTLLGGGALVGVRASQETDLIDVCLQNPRELSDTAQRFRLPLVGETSDGGKLFGGYVRGMKADDVWGLRASGLYEPPYHLKNYDNFLVHPYAERIIFHARQTPNRREQFPPLPYGVVVNPNFDWQGDRKPRIRPEERVIYEAHVKGLTMLHPKVPRNLRGTFDGARDPNVIRHLKDLGITTIELLPVHQSTPDIESHNGLPNYWGYKTLGFFAPDSRYGSPQSFKRMVHDYHRAGIEVSLDVVYNHTAEGGAGGPVYNFKGLDNAGMYHMDWHGNYKDFTGCGNTLNFSRPAARNMAIDSLVYWVRNYHIDRFRFDLMTAMMRDDNNSVNNQGPFLREILSNQVLKDEKVGLDVEPWDAAFGYQLDFFKHTPGVHPWDDGFRNNARRFWNNRPGESADINWLSYGLTGSETPKNEEVIMIDTHDGFTLRDLVSYDQKHNEANNHDDGGGTDNNISYNHGLEGDKGVTLKIHENRLKTAMNMLGTLFMADGTPLFVAGDEMWRTQRGNNNAYCQDNEISWLPWEWNKFAVDAYKFTRAYIKIRRENDRAGEKEWLNIWGNRMEPREWHNGENTLGVYLPARRIGRDIIYYVNRMRDPKQITLPQDRRSVGNFELLINTGNMQVTIDRPIKMPSQFTMEPNSTMILRRAR